jgi:uncharacterized protein
MHLFSRRVSARNMSRGTILGERIRLAESALSGIVGLLGERKLTPGDGLLIVPSQGVHTLGMQFPIDVLILDNDWKILDIRKRMRPFLITRIYFKAAGVLELPPGTVEDSSTCIGDSVEFARIQETR